MGLFISLALPVLKICAFKVQKGGYVFRKIAPSWNFKQWEQNLWFMRFHNWFLKKSGDRDPVSPNCPNTPNPLKQVKLNPLNLSKVSLDVKSGDEDFE